MLLFWVGGLPSLSFVLGVGEMGGMPAVLLVFELRRRSDPLVVGCNRQIEDLLTYLETLVQVDFHIWAIFR